MLLMIISAKRTMMKMFSKFLLLIAVSQLSNADASMFKRRAAYMNDNRDESVETTAKIMPSMLQFHRCLAKDNCSSVFMKDSQNRMEQWQKVSEIAFPHGMYFSGHC